MSLFLHQYVQARQLEKIKNMDLSQDEEINMIKYLWAGGNSDIHSILNILRAKKYKINVSCEEHVMLTSLSKVKKTLLTLFSTNQKMKSFTISSINTFNNNYSEFPVCFWQSEKSDNKLILVNFAKIPTGNMIFNKYVYSFNYFELQLAKEE